jgi:hypothetical protein
MKRLIIAVAAAAALGKQCVFARVPCGSGDAPPTSRSDALSGSLRKRQHAPIPDEISGRPWPVTARSGSGRGAASCSLVRCPRDTNNPYDYDRDEDIMPQPNDADMPRLDLEAWRAFFRSSVCAQYTPECAEPDAFTGWVRPLNMFGFSAVDVACNKRYRIERTQRDIRLDGVDVYGVLFQVAGRSTVRRFTSPKAMSRSSTRPAPRPTSMARERACSTFHFRAGR